MLESRECGELKVQVKTLIMAAVKGKPKTGVDVVGVLVVTVDLGSAIYVGSGVFGRSQACIQYVSMIYSALTGKF